jgi:hypothetical protein
VGACAQLMGTEGGPLAHLLQVTVERK